MYKLIQKLLIASLLAILTACGSGGEGGGSGAEGASNPPDTGAQTTTKSFTVSLVNVEIARISNGEAVDIDTAGITNTGSVRINQ